MSTYAIGDIHGGLRGLNQVLDKIQVDADDTLIFLGDYVDGWSESAQVIDCLIELSQFTQCIFIKGNHDIWCEQWLGSGVNELVWLSHGGQETIQSYSGFSEEQKAQHLKFFQNMEPYHIDAKNRLFVHAGFKAKEGVTKELDERHLYFDRTLWETALSMDKKLRLNAEAYPERFKNYSEIYIGHTPTINYNTKKPMHAANVWNIDTGAAFTGKLSVIDIDTKTVYQSKSLNKLYPDELGRNK